MITATDLGDAPEITKAELYAVGAKLAAFEIPTPIDPRLLRQARQEVLHAINDSTDGVRVAGVYHEARTRYDHGKTQLEAYRFENTRTETR